MNTTEAINAVIEAAGGVGALASKLKVKPPTVSQWRSGVRPVPPRLALHIQQHFPAIVSARDLRPDIFTQASA